MKKVKMRQCVMCGNTYLPIRENQKFCCKTCKERKANQQRNETLNDCKLLIERLRTNQQILKNLLNRECYSISKTALFCLGFDFQAQQEVFFSIQDVGNSVNICEYTYRVHHPSLYEKE